MSISFPSVYSSAIKRPFKENWLVKLFYDSDPDTNPNNCLRLAFGDTTVDSQDYYGVISGEPETIEVIDLSKGTAKADQVSLQVINFKYNGDDLSAELFGGSNKYINKDVLIYSQLNDESVLANCALLYEGRLVDVYHGVTMCYLRIVQKRPWHQLSIPNDKSNSQIYVPVAYGGFTKNANPSFATSKDLYPAPFTKSQNGKLYFLTTKAETVDAMPHFYDKTLDLLAPFDNGTDLTAVFDGKDTVNLPIDLTRSFRFRAEGTNAGNQFPTDPEKAYDTSDTTFAQSSSKNVTSSGGVGAYVPVIETELLKIDLPEFDGKVKSIRVYVKADVVITSIDNYSSSALTEISLIDYSFGAGGTLVSRGGTDPAGTTSTSGFGPGSTYARTADLVSDYNANNNKGPGSITLQGHFEAYGGDESDNNDNIQGYIKVYDAFVEVTVESDYANEPTASYNKSNDLKTVYIGADGLAKSYNGGSGSATKLHEIHRDILARFCGFDVADGSLLGWSDLDTDRATWLARLWGLEPSAENVKKILWKLAYEGGFVFRLRPGGGGRYIHIKNSYSTGDVVHTLSKNDLVDLEITHTPLSNLITKRAINYKRHPAISKYLSKIEAVNSTSRTNWNFGSLENIKEINLDYYVAPDPSTDPTAGNINDDFATYYNWINGDIILWTTGYIVNPLMYDVEAGDILAFDNSNMLVDPFGESWTNKAFIIVKLGRGVGRRSFVAMEAGAIS